MSHLPGRPVEDDEYSDMNPYGFEHTDGDQTGIA